MADMPGLAVSDPVPGIYLNVQFGAGAASGDLGPKKVLMVGPSTSDGTIAQDTEIAGPFSTLDEVKRVCGNRSHLRRMIEAFWLINNTTPVYAIAPTRSAGTPATLATTLVAAGGATGVGVIGVRFAGESVEVAFAQGDSVTQIMADLAAAINARTNLPATAAAVAGVLTLTAAIPGPDGNALRAQFFITPGVVTSLSNLTDTAFAGGATQTSFTNALAAIASQKFKIIVGATHAGAGSDPQLTAVANQVASQALPATGIRQVALSCCSMAASTFVTLCQSINKPRVMLANMEESPMEPWVNAAMIAAVFANTYFNDPASNLDGYGYGTDDVLPMQGPRNKPMAFTRTEKVLQLNGGGTPLEVSDAGTVAITRMITTRCLDGSSADYKTRDAHRVFVADRYADDWYARLQSLPYKKLTKDLPEGSQAPDPDATFATPSRLKSAMKNHLSAATAAGYLDPESYQKSLDSISVSVEPLNPSIANISIVIYPAVLFHQSRTNIADGGPPT